MTLHHIFVLLPIVTITHQQTKNNTMRFSWIVPYRNREIDRVQNCLQSIQKQDFTDFEIIFIDYGSNLDIQKEIEQLCAQFPSLHYFYFNTQKQFWSRSHALNLGIQRAKGEFLAVVDVDLIYPPYFLDRLSLKIDTHTFVQYQCYYLPENQQDYQNLDFLKTYPYKVSSVQFAAGLIAVPADKMKEIGGYDEYFKVWGVEDMDLKKRLESLPLKQAVLAIEEAPTFHQWHPSAFNADQMPALWLSAMEKYAKRKAASPLPYLNNEFKLARTSLSILHDIDNQENKEKYFYFEYPTLQAFGKFAQAFYSLKSGEYLIVNQRFESIKASEKSKLAGVFSKMNQWLEQLKISYRITELQTFETEMVNFVNVRDFLFYFIADNQSFIQDYAFDITYPTQIKCVLIKQ
jgi:glycosyltransferase involved in cell wall biosynthesis